MSKLIALLVAVIPIILFLKSFFGKSQAMKRASSELRRQIDYMVWAILFFILCGIVYSAFNLIHPIWK